MWRWILVLLFLILFFIYQNLVFSYDIIEFENGTQINFIEDNKVMIQRENESQVLIPEDSIKNIKLNDNLTIHKTPFGLMLQENNEIFAKK